MLIGSQSFARGNRPSFEPGLDEILSSNLERGHLVFTTSMEDAVNHAEAMMIAVGTPPVRGWLRRPRSCFNRGPQYWQVDHKAIAGDRQINGARGYVQALVRDEIQITTRCPWC